MPVDVGSVSGLSLFCVHSVDSHHLFDSGKMGGVKRQPREERQQEVEAGEAAFFQKLLQWVSLVGTRHELVTPHY